MSFSPIQLIKWEQVVCFYFIHRSNKKTSKKNPKNKKHNKNFTLKMDNDKKWIENEWKTNKTL